MENKTELPLVAVDGIPVEKPAEHKPVMTWASTGEAVAQHHQCGPECTVEHAITASPTAAQRCDELERALAPAFTRYMKGLTKIAQGTEHAMSRFSYLGVTKIIDNTMAAAHHQVNDMKPIEGFHSTYTAFVRKLLVAAIENGMRPAPESADAIKQTGEQLADNLQLIMAVYPEHSYAADMWVQWVKIVMQSADYLKAAIASFIQLGRTGGVADADLELILSANLAAWDEWTEEAEKATRIPADKRGTDIAALAETTYKDALATGLKSEDAVTLTVSNLKSMPLDVEYSVDK